jgi:hypothetical protein
LLIFDFKDYFLKNVIVHEFDAVAVLLLLQIQLRAHLQLGLSAADWCTMNIRL